jgi:hypothetical protein
MAAPGRNSGCSKTTAAAIGATTPATIAELAMPFSRFASRALVKALENPKERVPAAVALLNRGWGLPRQSIETDPATSAIGLHLLAAQAISAQLIQRQSEPQPRTIQHEPQLQRLVDEPGPTE